MQKKCTISKPVFLINPKSTDGWMDEYFEEKGIDEDIRLLSYNYKDLGITTSLTYNEILLMCKNIHVVIRQFFDFQSEYQGYDISLTMSIIAKYISEKPELLNTKEFIDVSSLNNQEIASCFTKVFYQCYYENLNEMIQALINHLERLPRKTTEFNIRKIAGLDTWCFSGRLNPNLKVDRVYPLSDRFVFDVVGAYTYELYLNDKYDEQKNEFTAPILDKTQPKDGDTFKCIPQSQTLGSFVASLNKRSDRNPIVCNKDIENLLISIINSESVDSEKILKFLPEILNIKCSLIDGQYFLDPIKIPRNLKFLHSPQVCNELIPKQLYLSIIKVLSLAKSLNHTKDYDIVNKLQNALRIQ